MRRPNEKNRSFRKISTGLTKNTIVSACKGSITVDGADLLPTSAQTMLLDKKGHFKSLSAVTHCLHINAEASNQCRKLHRFPFTHCYLYTCIAFPNTRIA